MSNFMLEDKLDRAGIDKLAGPSVLEFGVSWCTHCKAAQQMITSALASFPSTKHFKIEDNKEELLGRSYLVKLWPTLVFIRDGIEVERLVRPTNLDLITSALQEINNAV